MNEIRGNATLEVRYRQTTSQKLNNGYVSDGLVKTSLTNTLKYNFVPFKFGKISHTNHSQKHFSLTQKSQKSIGNIRNVYSKRSKKNQFGNKKLKVFIL